MNSSRSSNKSNGGAAHHRSTTRKSPTKKFGKNLNKLTSQKLSAPPVPVPNSIRGTTSFSGTSSSRNGLLLLSTKSKASTINSNSSSTAVTNNTAYTPEGARAAASGVLAPLGRPSTAHDKLLQSAGSRTDVLRLDGTIDKSRSTATPAWGGIAEKKQSSELPTNKNEAPMLLQAGRPSVPISKEVPWINERLITEPPSIDRRNNTTSMLSEERVGDHNRSYRSNYSGDYNNRNSGDYNNYNRNGDYNNRTGGDYRNRDSPGDYRSGGDYRSSSRFENRDYNRNGEQYHHQSASRVSRYNTEDSYQMASSSSRYNSESSRDYNRNGDTSYQSASRFGSRSSSSSGYNNDSSLGEDYRSSKRHNDRDNMQQQQEQLNQPPVVKDRFANISSSNVKEISQNVEKVTINEENPNKIKINTEAAGVTQSGDNKTTQPTASTPTRSSGSPAKDDQVEYMSKLAKERQEKRRVEEEERVAAQKERAAARLRELEGKRMEEKKKEQQVQSETRKELSKPSMPLELLGKSKKDTATSEMISSDEPPGPSSTTTAVRKPLTLSPPKRASPTTNTEKKKVERTLYDPDRPFSSLVGGKGGSNTDKQLAEVSAQGNTNKSPVHGPSPTPVAGFSATTDNKKGAAPIPIQMVRLSDLRSDEQVGRGEKGGGGVETTVDSQSGGGPRLLFDPTSGGMVSASVKNSKQKRSSKDTSKTISRGSLAAVDGPDTKPVRGKQGKGNRKDDATAPPQRNKKRQPSKKRNPRTRGVLYKLDKGGNYMSADGCEPDNGYGSHRFAGGKVKNPTAYAKLMKKEEVQTTEATALPNDMTVTTTTTTATEGFSTATEGFSYRNDPGFIQHQFEAQQQKILEDAWASLVENEDDEGGGEQQASVGEQGVPTTKSGDDEYAAALAISPSRIGLNFDTNNNMDSIMLPPAIAKPSQEEDPIDLAKFAFETTSSATTQQPAANPFASLGTGLWGGGSSAGGVTTSTSYGDLGALTGWAPTPFAAPDTTTETAGQSSKLGLWGSSALDDVGLGALGGGNKSEETTNGTD